MSQQFERNGLSRRNLLKFGIGAVGVGSLTGWLGTGALARTFDAEAIAADSPQLLASTPGVATSSLTPDQALQQLMAGNQRFMNNKRLNPHQNSIRLKEVAKGQAPFAAVLSCADSRVVPEIIFDQGIGDIFVVRVAGNVATVEELASEEYATAVLGAPLLMVLGHKKCGAVKAALEAEEVPGVIGSLVLSIRPAIEAVEGKPGDPLENAVKANVALQAKRLQSSPVIFKLVQQGKLKVVGGYYDLDTGVVTRII